MKKALALLLTLSLSLLLFAGCGTATSGAVKTGLAVITSIAKSKDATVDADGLAETDSAIVAVTVDNTGKIVKCVIDAAQTKINFTAVGALTTDVNTIFKTKDELGDEYGMKKASSIGKEWYEEAAALAIYVVGKTIEEVKGIAVNEEGAPADAELAASVTISIGDYVNAIEKAVNNVKDLGAKAGDKLGLGVITTIAKSLPATIDTAGVEQAGIAQAYSSYTATTFDVNGKITSCIIDASQSNVNFSAVGIITSDLASAPKTKLELGDEYGMKKASAIGKEWNEQANALANYVVGKAVTEVKGIAVTDAGVPADAELAASVTIHIGDYIAIIEKANVNAK